MDGRGHGRQGDLCLTSGGVRMLDHRDPYYEEQVSGSGQHGSGPIPVLNSDSPSHALLNKVVLEIIERYQKFLIWHPTRFGGSFRVPKNKLN